MDKVKTKVKQQKNISLPEATYKRLLKSIKDSGYQNPTAYATFLINSGLDKREEVGANGVK